MIHRIFVALPTSDVLRKKVEDWKRGFKLKNPDVSNKIRWMPPENLHITLIPPFNKDEEGIKKVIETLTNIQGKIGKFELNFEKISYGPTVHYPRLVWISGKSHKSAEGLKSLLEELLKLSRDNRQFSPHLTIARFREHDFRTFSLKRLDELFEFRETFEEFLLMESKTLPEGAQYSVLGKFTI